MCPRSFLSQFDDEKWNRDGTDQDLERLKRTFENLNFQVDIQNNLTARRIEDKLLQVTNKVTIFFQFSVLFHV